MNINQIIELSMLLDYERFHQIFKRVYGKAEYIGNKEDEYIDRSLEEKGITIIYRDSQYKKKINVIINLGTFFDGNNPNPDKIVRKIDKRISEYFDFKYRIGDFTLSGMIFVADINVHSRESVAAYLKVLQRIGKVKRFSPTTYEHLDGVDSFCLDGNSNGVAFSIYDFEGMCRKRFKDNDMNRKRLKTIIKESKGILRVEINFTKAKAIRTYTKASDALGQAAELIENCQEVFLDTFTRIIPFGNFYKKDKAVEIIQNKVGDNRLRRKMLRLVALIPEKNHCIWRKSQWIVGILKRLWMFLLN